ncbi:MAG: hypothetical protein SGPRY_001476 [Prymnesium sp.]
MSLTLTLTLTLSQTYDLISVKAGTWSFISSNNPMGSDVLVWSQLLRNRRKRRVPTACAMSGGPSTTEPSTSSNKMRSSTPTRAPHGPKAATLPSWAFHAMCVAFRLIRKDAAELGPDSNCKVNKHESGLGGRGGQELAIG